MLARSDETHPVWGEPRTDDAVLRPGYRPVCLVPEDRRARLLLRGVNTLQAVRSVSRIGTKPRTLAAGAAGTADWQSLAARRLALFIINCIERGTRWVGTTEPSAEVAQHVATHVRAFFEQLHEDGAFGARRREQSYFVLCDRRFNAADERRGEFQFLVGIRRRAPRGISHLSDLPQRHPQPRHAREPQPCEARRALPGGAQVGRRPG